MNYGKYAVTLLGKLAQYAVTLLTIMCFSALCIYIGLCALEWIYTLPEDIAVLIGAGMLLALALTKGGE